MPAPDNSEQETASESALDENLRLVRAGPDGELMTEERHQYWHWLAIYCAPAPQHSTVPAVRFLEAGHDLMHFGGLHEELPARLDRTVAALFQMADREKHSVINIDERALAKFSLPAYEGQPLERMCYRL